MDAGSLGVIAAIERQAETPLILAVPTSPAGSVYHVPIVRCISTILAYEWNKKHDRTFLDNWSKRSVISQGEATMMKPILSTAAVVLMLSGSVFAQDAVMCDQPTLDKLQADADMKLTDTNKDPADSKTAEKSEIVTTEIAQAKAAMDASKTDECVMHINKAMEALNEPG